MNPVKWPNWSSLLGGPRGHPSEGKRHGEQCVSPGKSPRLGNSSFRLAKAIAGRPTASSVKLGGLGTRSLPSRMIEKHEWAAGLEARKCHSALGEQPGLPKLGFPSKTGGRRTGAKRGLVDPRDLGRWLGEELCKPENLSSEPRHQRKRLGVGAYPCNPGLGRQKERSLETTDQLTGELHICQGILSRKR